MKKISFILLLAVIYGSVSCSQSSQAGNPENGAAIRFEQTEHDYGTIPQGGDGTYEFVFQNTGKEPLLLNNVRSSCGCTVPEWPKEPIAAGEEGLIKVSYNTRITGSFTKSISVYTNADDRPIVLVVKGSVEEAAE